MTAESIIELEIRAFLGSVINDECLIAWFLGQLSDGEILDRLCYLKSHVVRENTEAEDKEDEEAAKDREFDEKKGLGYL